MSDETTFFTNSAKEWNEYMRKGREIEDEKAARMLNKESSLFYIGDPGKDAPLVFGPEIKSQNELVQVIKDAKAEIERLKKLHWTKWRKQTNRYGLLNGIINLLQIENYNLKINSKSMEIKPGKAEPKSANPLPLLWESIKYIFRLPLARNIIIALLLVAAVLLGGNYLLEKAKLSADRVNVQIKDDKGNMIINSSLSATLVNIYSNIVDLKARFQVDEKNQVGNISQYIQEEIAKQLQQKGL